MCVGLNSKTMNTPFENAMTQLESVAAVMQLDTVVHERLKYPEKLHIVALPITMDDGAQRVFTGYRSQYSSARGHYKGGIRFADNVDADEVKALSFWMAIKTAVVGLPLGGGKGGITVNPRELSEGELERVSRAWVRALYDNLGPHKDVPAPDVATNPKVMGWMVDEYSRIAGEPMPAAFTGKLPENGGIVARDTSTARGGFYLLEEMRTAAGKTPEEYRVAVQGFGNAGRVFAELAFDAGYQIVGLSDSRGTILADEGESLDPRIVAVYKKEYDAITGTYCKDMTCDNAERRTVPLEDYVTVDCDVLVLAAVENQIREDNAADITASLVLELANGPTTPEADLLLEERSVTVLPDVLANAGGVIVSHYEWEQNISGETWSEEDTNAKLKKQIVDAYQNIVAHKKSHDVTLRTAAFIHALDAIAQAMKK